MSANYTQLIRTRDEAERKLRALRETFEARPHAFTEGHKRLAIARAEQWLRICQAPLDRLADATAAREERSK